MKKYLVLVLSVAIFACTQQTGYKITVDLEGAEGQLLLEKMGAGKLIPVDTAEIVDGIAVFEGEVAYPQAHFLSVAGQRAKTMVFVENTKIEVSGKVDSLAAVKVNGSVTHDAYQKLSDEIQEVSEKFMALYQQSREASAAGDTAKANQLMETVNEMYESTNTMQEDFIIDNPASYATPYFLTRVQHGKEADELEKLVEGLDPKLDEVQAVKDLKDKIEKLKRVAIGQIAPEFTQNDPDGNPIKFSDIYSQNELTLLDFWAAWCGPCRRENPNVVAVYNDFKDQGFTVFGVSLDRDKDAWLKAIEDDKLTWKHVSDLSYWDNAAAKLYAVSGIPHSLLVDKNGKIIAKNKREDELREAVAEYFEK
jgi:peroxiredoxin